MKLIKENVKIEWVRLGEGLSGDFDPEDPEDEELLRFDVFRWDEEIGAWGEVPDASYCTFFPANATDAQRRNGLEFIMAEVFEPVRDGHSVKKLCERLSHIDPSWGKTDRERQLINHLELTIASLENVLLQFAGQMTSPDARGRQNILGEAKQCLKTLS